MTVTNRYTAVTIIGDDQGVIRHATALDAPGVAAIYEPFVRHTAVSFEVEPPTASEIAARMARSLAWLVLEQEGRVLGYAYAAPFHERAAYRWAVEVSIYLAEDVRGRGWGRWLLDELLKGLTLRGFVTAFAGTTLPNPASVGLFESAGFEKIAHQKNVGFKLGAWHDVGWWQRQLGPLAVPPKEPT